MEREFSTQVLDAKLVYQMQRSILTDMKSITADGMNIRRVEGSDDNARRKRVELFVECLEGSCTSSPDSTTGTVQVVQELIDVLKEGDIFLKYYFEKNNVFRFSVKQYKWLVPVLEDEPLTTEFLECFKRMQKIDKLKDILGYLMPELVVIHASEVAENMLRDFLNDNERYSIGL